MNLTESQRLAISHRGSHLLVTASAGAGKTEVLARRCLALVTDPERPCGLDRLLVVTFTRAAAAELRVRIARMLRAELEAVTSPAQRRHLCTQQVLVDAAEIGTIDAWSGRVLREHFAAAGVAVQFSVLSAEEARVLRAEVLGELFAELHRGTDDLARRAREWMGRHPAPDDGFVRAMVGELNAFREHLVNPDEWLARQRALVAADDPEALLAGALREELEFQGAQLCSVVAGATGAAADHLRSYATQLREWHRRLASAGELSAVVAALAEYDLARPRRGRAADAEDPLLVEVRRRWLTQRLKKAWPAQLVDAIIASADTTRSLLVTLLDVEQRYHELLRARKQARATYEFSDVLRMTLDLLGRPRGRSEREPTEIALRLRERYEHVLVDEYQDTSPVQVELLRLVSRTGPGQANRFMVGDVKQSIYGFRQAEPRLFTTLSAAYEAGCADGQVLALADNFRSHAGVIDALNGLFERLFDPALGGTAYGAREALRAARAANELPNATLEPQPRVRVHVIEHDARRRASGEDDEQRPELMEREAQLAAEQIAGLTRAGVMIPAKETAGGLRAVRLRDIVILLRSAVENAALVARVLRANGIACVTDGRESLLDSVEVNDVLNVLRLLVNRRQDVPLASYLRSPLVGLGEAELLEVSQAATGAVPDFYAAVEAYRARRPRESVASLLDAALTQLDGWSQAAGEEELPALLERIYRASGLTMFAEALRDGPQRVALLRSLQAHAAQFARGAGGGLDDFVEYVAALSTEEARLGGAVASDEDAVRIMTIHGAKGLEFPVVFLLGAGACFNTRGRRAALLCDIELGIGLRCDDYESRARLVSPRYPALARAIGHRELEEELRLLYVAATRARESLTIIGHAPEGTWARYQELFATPPALLSRLCAGSRLEWVLMAAAAGRTPGSAAPRWLSVTTHTPESIHVAKAGQRARLSPDEAGPPCDLDESWLQRARELVFAEVDTRLSGVPAVLSVSAAKELLLRGADGDRPKVVLDDGPPLRIAIDDRQASDGLELGRACHRFLEHADICRELTPAEVQRQLNALVGSGRMTAAEAALVPAEDMAWFSATPAGELLRADGLRVRREVPFVYALPIGVADERTIVRGVIDCMVETPDGLVIYDYKTDGVAEGPAWEERIAGYRFQVQLYAAAAAAAFNRPVHQALLVFLRRRKLEAVSLAATVESQGLFQQADPLRGV